jgi:hypothetical protein
VSRPPHRPDAAATRRAARKASKRGRAKRRQAFVAARAGTFNLRALNEAMAARVARDAGGRGALRAFPVGDVRRWVPIGPSVVRRGQALGRPRVTGRIRDLAVSGDGQRAYAASAKGGVWYTGDGGSTWAPVGGWADRTATAGGNNNAQACGCLLVAFDAGGNVAQDFVMAGTGELLPRADQFVPQHGGLGVLAARGPAAPGPGAQPWENEAGIAQFEGLGVFRLARRPGSVGGSVTAGVTLDRVVAATSAGLFLGTRRHVAVPVAHDEFGWAPVAGLNALAGLAGPNPSVTDVLWLTTGAADGRLLVAVNVTVGAVITNGVAFSDDAGATWAWVTGLDPTTGAGNFITGRMSLSEAAPGRVYVLGEVVGVPSDVPTLWQLPGAIAPVPAAVVVPGLPNKNDLWGGQQEYDQAIAVDGDVAVDRIYVGGSTIMPRANTDWSASLWCFEVPVPPAAPGALVPSPGISTIGTPTAANPTRAGADQPGLIGNTVHADIHAIRLTARAGGQRQVWVGCDGGVFVSTQSGRCNTFASRVVGLAALEVGFHASHPTSSHFVAIGCQDAGTQARQGDTVWEMILEGDGGGTIFHPVHSQYIVSQWTQAAWLSRPGAGFIDPVTRTPGGGFPPQAERENAASGFYCGAAAVALSPTVGRIAVGTERVWISDDLDGVGSNHWRVIGFPAGLARDARSAAGAELPLSQTWGVPVTAAGNAIGPAVQLRWVTGQDLLALYGQSQAVGTPPPPVLQGLVRYTQNPLNNQWANQVLIPDLAGSPAAAGPALFTDICPVPGTQDFYLTTTGDPAVAATETCWFFEAATNTFHATGLRATLGPLNPAYAVAVDPGSPRDVYVGTVTGVWHSQRAAAGAVHSAWNLFDNGLPQATVQDLAFWTDPAGVAGRPRLLRAAVQSRGVWEVDLAGNEAQRTYARVHMRDDRRIFPTPLADPRLRPGATPMPIFASPDLTVRPAANPAAAPAWQFGVDTIRAGNAPRYQLWTFQTAFRWIYPSIAADGLWTDQMGDLLLLDRRARGMSANRFIDRNLWNAVVRDTHLDATGAVTAVAADPRAVYRAPWQSQAALTAVATEVDLMELVAPVSVTSDVWRVFREPCTVDVLVHHRDTRPLAARAAVAVLLWQSHPDAAHLLALPEGGLAAYVQSLATAAPLAAPVGWNVVLPPAAPAVPPFHPLPVPLDARIPRAIPIDVDLSGVPVGHRVLFVAFVGSIGVDPFTVAPSGATPTVADLVQRWPYACMRLVRVANRP